MRIGYRKISQCILLMVILIIVSCQLVHADSGFVNMEDGAVATVGQPYTIQYIPGYYSSSGTLYAHIEIVSPDNKLIQHEKIEYKDMYELVECTFTPEMVGIYKINGYCSLKHRVYISRYPVEKYVINDDRETAIKEAVLVVECSTHSYGEWKVVKEATSKEEGEEQRTCTVCNKVETRSIPLKEDCVPTSVKTKVKKSSVTVSWGKIGEKELTHIKSIQVQYATNKKFTKNLKTKKVKKDKTKYTLTLKTKTIYYVRVRYVGKNGVSKWSKVVKVKVK